MADENTLPDSDDLLQFADEDDSLITEVESQGYWKILIVDDDHEIHAVTELALNGVTVLDRELSFLHAYSAEEAKSQLQQQSGIAVVLLDVVMESDAAGLHLAKYIREQLKLEDTRIILRTGQPGYAPEEQVIKDYDINDYKTKTELTRNRLVTSLITAIRSYHQIRMLNQNRQGLELIVKSSANLLERHAMNSFAEGVLTQLASIIGLEPEGILCAKRGNGSEEDPEGIYILGAAGHYAQFVDRSIDDLPESDISNMVTRCLEQHDHNFSGDKTVLYINSTGHEAAVYIESNEPLEPIDIQLIEVFLANISVGYENVSLFQSLQNAAYVDELTRLPNRTAFIRELDGFTQQAETDTIALVDISQFSDINDGLGQDTGNLLLIAVAKRLQHQLPEGTMIARVSADSYGIIGDHEVLSPDRLLDLFQHPFVAGEYSLPLKANIGLCQRASVNTSSGIDLLKKTIIALNGAKKDPANHFQYYDPEQETLTRQRLDLIRRLRQDFAERKLQLWYQPQLNLKDESVVGAEALLRWPDGEGGFISPVTFIPLAEYSGLIIDIGAWVMEEACRQLKHLHQIGFSQLNVAVNVSMQQFRNPNFLSQVFETLDRTGIAAGHLELEITESVVMDEPENVIATLAKLREAGVKVSIDDFGTGFSSLQYLQRLPLDRIKIDRSFVSGEDSSSCSVIADTIVTLGRQMALTTICEGVETTEQADYMREIGCDQAQGYLYAKPMPIDQLISYLKQR